jgi:hypothetical protein
VEVKILLHNAATGLEHSDGDGIAAGVALNPDDPIIRLNRLKLHQELGNTETALTDLKHVMEASPELAEKELNKNLLFELQGSNQ